MATRLMITLTSEEAEALARLSYSEMRDPRNQLRLLLRRAAHKRGLIPNVREMKEAREIGNLPFGSNSL